MGVNSITYGLSADQLSGLDFGNGKLSDLGGVYKQAQSEIDTLAFGDYRFELYTPLTSDDLMTLFEVAKAAFGDSPDERIKSWFSFSTMVKHIKEGIGACIVARNSNREIIGFIYGEQGDPINGEEGRDKWSGYIDAVLPGYQGKGIGTSLIKAREIAARNFGASRMLVFTNLPDLAPLQDAERKINFRDITVENVRNGVAVEVKEVIVSDVFNEPSLGVLDKNGYWLSGVVGDFQYPGDEGEPNPAIFFHKRLDLEVVNDPVANLRRRALLDAYRATGLL